MTEAPRLPRSVVAHAIAGGNLVLGPPTGPRWRSLPLDPESVSAARHFTDMALANVRRTDKDHVDNVDIVVSELVTNAVRHTAFFGTTVCLGIAVLPRWTHVLVEDPLPDAPAPAPLDDEPDLYSIDALSLSGRGLGIVGALTARFRFVERASDKTAHAIILRTDVKLTESEQKALDRLVSV